ncbi:N-acetylmuramoyl-L-alanine amidase [Candidatus Hepatincolaceae symbiont of Richtersius coronifer]
MNNNITISAVFASPNFNNRTLPITMLIMHYTISDFQGTINTFLNPASKVSSHYLINTDGKTYECVAEDKRSWHAGLSKWESIINCNSASLGLEIVNAGYVKGKQPSFTEPQLVAVEALSKYLILKYNIKPHLVVGHSDIAPDRKIDPGPAFPWKRMAKSKIGLFPTAKEIAQQETKLYLGDEKSLHQFGYNVKDKAFLDFSKKAFQLHYNTDAYRKNLEFGEQERRTLQALLALKKATV